MEKRRRDLMGKATDGAIAIFVLIIMVIVLSRMGITLPVLWHTFTTFVHGTGTSGTNTTGTT